MNGANVFERPNPFLQQMKVLKCPPGMAEISIDGFQLQPDENGHVMVPADKALRLRDHGCMILSDADVAAMQAAAAKKK